MKKIIAPLIFLASAHAGAYGLQPFATPDDPMVPAMVYVDKWLTPVESKEQCYSVAESLMRTFEVATNPRHSPDDVGAFMLKELESVNYPSENYAIITTLLAKSWDNNKSYTPKAFYEEFSQDCEKYY